MRNIPLLILYGWNLSVQKFNPLITELKSREYRVVCFDIPGFGSEKIPDKPLTLSDYSLFVEKKLNSLNISKVILIGHSFGGRIGIKLTSYNPKLIEALILTGAPGINPVPQIKIAFFLLLAKIGNTFFSLPVISMLKERARQLLYRGAKATDFYNTDKRMRETFKNIIKEDLKGYLRKIEIPTLLLWGSQDMIVPVKIAEEMLKLLSKAKLRIIPDARHGVPWTHPKLFADEVEKFIKAL